MNAKLAIITLIVGLAMVEAGPGRGGRGGRGGHGGRGPGRGGRNGKGKGGNNDNGEGGNADDPCSQEGTVFIEAPDIEAADIEACRQECEDDEGCVFFVFNTFAATSENCGLRDYEPSNLVTVNGQRAGFGNLVIENENAVLVGFALETDTIEECQASCEANRRCRTWSWTNADGTNPLLCVHNYGIADTALDVSDTTTSGRNFCDLTP